MNFYPSIELISFIDECDHQRDYVVLATLVFLVNILLTIVRFQTHWYTDTHIHQWIWKQIYRNETERLWKKIRDVQLFFYIPLIKLFVYVTVTKLGILNICKLHAITFFEQSPTLAKHMWKKLQIFKGKITNLDGEIIFAIGPAIFEIWAISTLHVLSITENKRKRDFHWNA